MKKALTVQKVVAVRRTLILHIALTGDVERDLIALEAYDFEGIDVMSIQRRDMVEKEHDPHIFYRGPKGVFSHSMNENQLFIWEETIKVEDF